MAMIERTTATADHRGANEHKFLSFCLGDEQFGV